MFLTVAFLQYRRPVFGDNLLMGVIRPNGGMVMHKRLASLLVFAAMPIASASAADIATRAPPPAPVPYAAYNWTGFYVGGEIGGVWATSQLTVVTNFSPSAFPPGTVDNPIDQSGVIGGFYGGYNYQINQFVVGIDGDFTWASADGTGTDVSSVNGDIAHHQSFINWIATVTGRLGYAWDNWLLFAKGGGAWEEFHGSTVTVTPGGETASITQNTGTTRDGWTVGGGVEWGFGPHWSAKLEYDYVKFQTVTFDVQSTSFIQHESGVFQRSETSHLNMVKAGVSYRF